MKWMLIAGALVLATATPANAFSCAQVQWAVAHLPTSVIEFYKSRASAEDVKKAKACLTVKVKAKKRKH